MRNDTVCLSRLGDRATVVRVVDRLLSSVTFADEDGGELSVCSVAGGSLHFQIDAAGPDAPDLYVVAHQSLAITMTGSGLTVTLPTGFKLASRRVVVVPARPD